MLSLYAIVFLILFGKNKLREACVAVASNKYYLGILILILVLTISSLIFSKEPIATLMIGTPPVYLGLLSWLAMIIFAIEIRKKVASYLISNMSITIMTAVIVISIFVDRHSLAEGLRLSGLITQSTSMAIYATLVSLVALYKVYSSKLDKKSLKISLLAIAVSIVAIILTQSRIGYLSLALGSGILGLIYANRSIKYLFASLFIVTLLPMAVISQSNYLNRIQASSIDVGMEYRMSLYTSSAKDLLNNNLVIGNGAGSLPSIINDPYRAPEDILHTLNDSYVFSSTHNTFLDLAYYFGIIFALIIFLIVSISITRGALSKNKEIYWLSILAMVLLLNAFFNVPSFELLSLSFIVIAYKRACF